MQPGSPRDDRSPWDAVAPRYADSIMSPLAEGVENPLWDWLPGLAGRHQGMVVDFGCGTGVLLLRLLRHWPSAVGLDFSGGMLAEAGRRAAREGRPGPLRLIQGDMRHLPLRPESVDLAFSINSLLPEDPGDAAPMLAELASALKPGRPLVAIFPALEAVLHLRDLRGGAYRRAGLGEEDVERFLREEFAVRHRLDEEVGLFAADGRHVQKLWRSGEIRRRLAACGLRVESLAEVSYPWRTLREFSFGNFPGEKPLWNWLVLARKEGGRGG